MCIRDRDKLMSARLHLQAARLIREFDVPAVELRRKALKPCHGIRSFRFNRKCPVVILLLSLIHILPYTEGSSS